MTKISKKIVSLFLVFALCFSAIMPMSAFAADEDVMQFIDECSDFSKIFSQSGALEVFSDTVTYDDELTIGRGVSARTAGMIQNMVYKITGNIISFEVIGHYNKTSSDLLTFYISQNGTDYTQIDTTGNIIERSDGWEYAFHKSTEIPEGISYLKIQFNGEQLDRNWDGRVGKVTINYKADLSLPGMAVYTPDYSDTTPTDVKDTEYADYVNFALGLGILDNTKDGLFKPDEEIARNDFALGVCRIINAAPFAGEENQVDASKSVELLKSFGAYNDITSTSKTITYEEAVKILVNALGYGASLSKGTDSEYTKAAVKAGLTTAVKNTGEKALTKGQAAILLYNAANADIMIQTGFGASKTYKVQKDVTPLIEYHKIYSEIGVVNANRATALTYNEVTIGKDEVQIDGVTYKIGNTSAGSMLGYNVEYYYQDTNDLKNTLVYVVPAEGMDIVEFESEDIESISSTRIEYYTPDGKKTKKVKISSTADMIYNGKACSFDIAKMQVPETKIKLMSSDGGTYNIAFVTHYDIHVADRITLSENTIHSKYKTDVALRYDPYDGNVEFFFAKNGKSISIGDINPWNILSVESATGNDGLTYSRVWVSDESVTGSIESMEKDSIGHIETVLINDKEYKVADDYITAANTGKAPKLELGAEGTFYLDINGSVAAFDEEEIRQGYAYLKEAYVDITKKNTIVFRMFTNNGEWITVESGPNEKYVYVNDVKTLNSAVITSLEGTSLEASSTAQVIKYRINKDNKLRRIYTVTAANNFVSNPNAVLEEEAINNGTLRLSKTIATAQYKNAASIMYDHGNRTTYGRVPILVSKDTMVLSIPAADISVEENYYLKDGTKLYDNINYTDVDYYDIDKFGHAALVVLKDGDSTDVHYTASRYIVKSITRATNDNGEDVYKIYLFNGAKVLEYLTTSDVKILKKTTGTETATAPFSITDINPGDSVQIATDRKNNIKVVCRWGNINDVYNGIVTNTPYKNFITSDSTKTGEFALMSGVIKDVDVTRGYFNVLTKVDSDVIAANTAKSANVYVVVYRNGKPYTIENKTLADIVVNDKVAVDLKHMGARNIVVVRDW